MNVDLFTGDSKEPRIFGFHYDDNELPFCTIYRLYKTEAKETLLTDMNEVMKVRRELYEAEQKQADYMKEAERTCKALEAQIAELQSASQVAAGPNELPAFAQDVIEKLRRFEACASDGQDVDIGREWFDTLTHLGLLNRIQRSPGRWQITEQGKATLEASHPQQEQ